MIDVSMAKPTGKMLHTVQLQCGDWRDIFTSMSPGLSLCPYPLPSQTRKGVWSKTHWHNSPNGGTGQGAKEDRNRN